MSLGRQLFNTGLVVCGTCIILLTPFIGQKANKIVYTLLGGLLFGFLLIPVGAMMMIWM